MKPFSIAWSNVRRMLRERSNIFFVFIFPIALILLIGVQFGGGVDPIVGTFSADDGDLSQEIHAAIEAGESFDVIVYETEEALVDAVELGSVQAGVFLPAGMDAATAEGTPVEIGYVARPDGFGAQMQAIVNSIVAEVMMPVGAAQYAAAETGQPFTTALAASQSIADSLQVSPVDVSYLGEALFPASLGQFDLGAASQLILFVFLTAMAGSAALILTRQLGISARMLSTPTSVGQIVVGESLGRFGVALVQGVYIMVLTLIIFSVNWGDPIGAIMLLIFFSAVGAGAGMLMGSVFSNDQQASGMGVMLSLGLAALGGCMLPIELFPPTMRTVAHVTPHAWALDGFAELVRRGGTVVDILPELGVLAAYAAALFALASWRLRVAITRP